MDNIEGVVNNMELTKYQSAAVLAHIRHDLREIPDGKSYGNESIDHELSKNNYSLINRGNNTAEINQYRKQLEKEIFRYNRKNVVRAVETVIQCPKDCPEEQKDAFFRESFNYICSTLPMGEKCVFVAEVHKDEKHYTPTGEMISKDHIHIMYIPAVPDTKHEGFQYKLCADQLTKRAKLKALHPGLQEHLDKCGIKATVYRKKDSDGKQISLTVKQLKQLTATTGITLDQGITVEQLGQIISKNVEYRKQLETIITNHNILSEINMKKDEEIKQLKEKVASLIETDKSREKELLESREKIQELESRQKDVDNDITWGNNNSWDVYSNEWGKYSTEIDEEKTW